MNYAELFKNEPSYSKVEKYDADWYVGKDGNTIRVRFQGTESFKDFIIDMLFHPSNSDAYDGEKYKVHTGFKIAYYSCRNLVLDKIYELYKEGDQIIVEGHSLGGAMAMLAAEDIGWHFKTKVLLITWGAPRPYACKLGVTTLYQYTTEDSKQFVNGSDWVPHLMNWRPDVNRNLIGEKYNGWTAFWDIMLRKFTYHCGYGKSELYL